MSLADDILGFDDRKAEPIDIPEWPHTSGKLFVRPMSGAERDSWEQHLSNNRKTGKDTENFRAKIAARMLVDADGKRIFTDDQAEKLGEKSGTALDKVFDVWTAMSKLDQASIEVEKKR